MSSASAGRPRRSAPSPEADPAEVARSMHPVARLPEQWRLVLEQWGERAYRGAQIFRWIHARGVLDPREMTDLAKPLRERLAAAEWPSIGQVERVARAADGTRKLVLILSDEARVECVLIPNPGAADSPPEGEDPAATEGKTDAPSNRVTLCVSTQYGCKMGCAFCASGQAGFRRHLQPEEIVGQVLAARRHLAPDEQLQNLVVMGMGEPLDAYEQTARALRLIMHPSGLGMSPRRITVSTVGVAAGIERLGRDFEGKVGLAVSLHAATDEVRNQIVPLNRKVPLARLLTALREYPLPPRRRITIEYTLIAGVNDDLAEAKRLAALLRGVPVKLNLIPMNLVPGSSLRAPDGRRVEQFRQVLVAAGYSCFLRTPRGDDVSAACGQLAFSTEAAAPGRGG
jgi:23S rRNA (adenine2503-C2)-methyltransferase